jgi:hypothetical protein
VSSTKYQYAVLPSAPRISRYSRVGSVALVTDSGSELRVADRGSTSSTKVSFAKVSEPVVRRLTVISVDHIESVSLCAATTSSFSRGWTVSRRSAYTRFKAYHSGFRIP